MRGDTEKKLKSDFPLKNGIFISPVPLIVPESSWKAVKFD